MNNKIYKSQGFKHVSREKGKDNQFTRLSFYILISDKYKALSLSAKIVMQAMQMQHRTHCYTSIGRKQIAGLTGLSTKTVSKALKLLLSKGWLVVIQGYNHLEKKTRTYELTWLSYNGNKPSDLWDE